MPRNVDDIRTVVDQLVELTTNLEESRKEAMVRARAGDHISSFFYSSTCTFLYMYLSHSLSFPSNNPLLAFLFSVCIYNVHVHVHFIPHCIQNVYYCII